MINSLGILKVDTSKIEFDLKMTHTEFRESCVELRDNMLVHFIKSVEDGNVYACVTKHPYTLANSVTVEKKMKKDYKSTPKSILNEMSSGGVLFDIESLGEGFIPPKKEEVIEYSLNQGYAINATVFIDFYENNIKGPWKDSKGRGVKDWKSKLRNVWFKEENKIKLCKDAPKGFESFYVEVEGEIITPDYWRDGFPRSKKGLVINKILKTKYYEESNGISDSRGKYVI
jgi:hypothetical protein